MRIKLGFISKNDELFKWGLVQSICLFFFQGSEFSYVFFYRVERNVGLRFIVMDDSEMMIFWFLCKSDNFVVFVFKFKNFDRNIMFFYMEKFKISVGIFFGFSVVVDFYS